MSKNSGIVKDLNFWERPWLKHMGIVDDLGLQGTAFAVNLKSVEESPFWEPPWLQTSEIASGLHFWEQPWLKTEGILKDMGLYVKTFDIVKDH